MFKQNRCYDMPMNNNMTFKFSATETESTGETMAMPMGGYQMGGAMMPSCQMPPVYECPQERVCHREIVHEVPHVCPINTRIVNHHIYRHTYTPCYTCCEEDVCSNVYEGSCCNF